MKLTLANYRQIARVADLTPGLEYDQAYGLFVDMEASGASPPNRSRPRSKSGSHSCCLDEQAQ